MTKSLASIIVTVIILFLVTSCKKETESLSTLPLSHYFPLEAGKTFLYRLDSTVPAPFGTELVVKSYLAKDSIESTFTDNQGRLSYRIFRFLTDTAALQPWNFGATFYATPTDQAIEYVDNNLRFLKLHAPVIEGYSWLAHSFIDTRSANSTLGYLDDWEYEYRDVNLSYTVFNTTYDSTATVFQHDETTPDGPFDPNNYYQLNKAFEVYAKGVGLIYKDFLHWTWQTTPPPSKYEDGSYGIKLRLISHN